MGKHLLYHRIHPTDKFLAYCKDERDNYQKKFKEFGHDHEYVPYPYTREVVKKFFEVYKAELGVHCDIDGPPREDYTNMLKRKYQSFKHWDHVIISQALNRSLHPDVPVLEDPMNKVEIKKMFDAKSKFTGSSPNTSMEFDADCYQEWDQWTKGKVIIEDVDASTDSICSDARAVEL